MDHVIRQNKVTKQWVIFAPSRRRRPTDLREAPAPADLSADAPHDPSCPFCPGNEEALGPVVEEVPGPPPQGWRTRVIPNKYPALSPGLDARRLQVGAYLAVGGHGRHEVIIESPYHNRDIPDMEPEEVLAVVDTYHRRHRELMARDDTLLTLTFRNRGVGAGASMAHPHSQVISLPVAPPYVRWREEEAQRYFDEWGRCCLCDTVAEELRVGERLVLTNPAFVAFVPFAAETPCEIWIVPRRHQADFVELEESEKVLLAQILRDSLRRVATALGRPDYNYVIHSSTQYRVGEPHVHWYLQILPRLTRRAGFEIGTNIAINPSLPEEDARLLRGGVPGDH
ncbi:galactose-1-phosphate uridylyltransferase [Deferrisoma palaeochoriense]